jgi:hypothetical protein
LARPAFKEISKAPKNISAHATGISLECQGIYIHVSEKLDPLVREYSTFRSKVSKSCFPAVEFLKNLIYHNFMVYRIF